ncbi:hypothetical protein N3K66_004511 [Trichothecium roseum]|uniref:Uncharacterized protein n=1 Tax=Trichothecium roseum TaxID=47278 RepID=A0ACC0V1D8_9HYPO|nr:hypothetical protein N3K66_004511 [Trichothecium roseum]
MTTPLKPFYQLKCSANSYPWGLPGKSSLAARLCAGTPGYASKVTDPFEIKEDEPYAEMWMGTYPSLPSYVASTDEPLQDVLDRYPSELLGDEITARFGHTQLPFLPKVLSIGKALPLQIHPDKEAAARLHREDPDKFGDDNHKPEIALAVETEFEAFVGFKPLCAVAELLQLEELAFLRVPGGDSGGARLENAGLREVVRKILTLDAGALESTFGALRKVPESWFERNPHNGKIPELLPRLAEDFSPGDPGILVALLTMNYLVLRPGQCLYIPADGIHAYLSGHIVECMARSDNVLNTGFCPASDRHGADAFCDLLTFTPHAPEECILPPAKLDRSEKGKTSVYRPPLSEFDVAETRLGPGEEETLGEGGAGILLCTKGGAEVRVDGGDGFGLGEGHVYFVGKGVRLDIKAGEDGLLMHQAYVE